VALLRILTLMLAMNTAGAAHAQDAADMARDDEIAVLKRQVEMLTQELGRVRDQVAVPEEPSLTSSYGLGPAASKIYGVERGLSIGGYGEFNYRNFVGDKDSDDLNRADFLRLVTYLGYKFSDRIVFNSEIEYEHATTSNVGNGAGGGSVSVEFAALDFFWRPEVNFRAGMLLLPMGFLNEIHEPPFFFGVSRPETEVRILPSTWRENGVGIFGNVGEQFTYRSYVVTGFNAANFSDSGVRSGRQKGNRALAEDVAWVTRMDYTPDVVPGLLVGGSFYIGNSGQNFEVEGGELPAVRMWIAEAHAQYNDGPFQARFLFAYTDLNQAGKLSDVLGLPMNKPVANEMLGGYLEAGYDLWPTFFGNEDMALEPFFRVEYVDTQFHVPTGYTANRDRAYWVYTPGVNFYPHPNVVLKAEYRNRATRGPGSLADEVAIGMGFAF
jgi:hypothetical protein